MFGLQENPINLNCLAADEVCLQLGRKFQLVLKRFAAIRMSLFNSPFFISLRCRLHTYKIVGRRELLKEVFK